MRNIIKRMSMESAPFTIKKSFDDIINLSHCKRDSKRLNTFPNYYACPIIELYCFLCIKRGC